MQSNNLSALIVFVVSSKNFEACLTSVSVPDAKGSINLWILTASEHGLSIQVVCLTTLSVSRL
jgi:hypothetical protein